MANMARQLGAEIFIEDEVIAMEVNGHEVKALETSQRKIKADLFVCAAGAWTADVAAQAGVDLPVLYERGEAMVSIPLPPLIRGMVTDGQLFAVGENPPDRVIGACLGQTVTGNIVIAQATTDVDNYDCSSTLDGPREVAQRVLKLFPKLDDLEILRMWEGSLPTPRTVPPCSAFLKTGKFACGGRFHSAIGIAPVLGKMVSDIFSTGSAAYDVSAYSPLRFRSAEIR